MKQIAQENSCKALLIICYNKELVSWTEEPRELSPFQASLQLQVLEHSLITLPPQYPTIYHMLGLLLHHYHLSLIVVTPPVFRMLLHL